MKTLYLVRHAESEGNAGTLQQGPTTPLSERGHEQAKEAARRFATIPVDRVFASPYLRAKQTAETIASVTGHEVEFNPLFVEWKRPSVSIGLEKGSPLHAQVDKLMRENFHDSEWRHSDEENFFDLKKRALEVLAFVQTVPEERVLVVTHGILMRLIIGCVLLGDEITSHNFISILAHIEHGNTGITIIESAPNRYGDTVLKLISYNDQSHLGDG